MVNAAIVALFAVVPSVVERVAPGEMAMLECSWDKSNVPLSVFVRPRLFARDDQGKTVWSGNVGTYYQHVVSAHPPHREKWCAAVRVKSAEPEEEKVSCARFQPGGLAAAVLPASAREIELKIVVEGGDFEPKEARASIRRVDKVARARG